MVPSLLCTFVAHITFLHVFFLPPPFILSLSLAFSFSLSLFSLSLSLSLPPLSLCGCKTHVIWCPLPNILFLINLTFSHHIFPYKIHQLFTDYLLRLPSSELLEKHLFRSRANRRLVAIYQQNREQTFWQTVTCLSPECLAKLPREILRVWRLANGRLERPNNRGPWRQTAGFEAVTTNACRTSACVVEAAAGDFKGLKAGKRQAWTP